MDLATIIGITGGLLLLLGSILWGGHLGHFVDLTALLLVVGGCVTTLFVRHPLDEVNNAVAVLRKCLFLKQPKMLSVIEQLVEMANFTRKNGILALEKMKSDDPFLQEAVNHCVDGADPEFLEHVLDMEVKYLGERHNRGRILLEGLGESAIAFGLLGTVVGLIKMVGGLEDPASLGAALSTAMVSTFYGALIAHLFAYPLAAKLANYSLEEQHVRRVIIDGMIGIQKGVNPRLLQAALKAALPPRLREVKS
ncbi:MAG: MotA/TolQ/ExbB proton channel family protein [Magnetococcales bacterium]|nr:MotA/TolQ/ExbB proton channel family protein [Magnetococcales bacterium]